MTNPQVIERFGAWIVEEDSGKSDDSTLFQVTVQFPNRSVVDSFLEENARYQTGQGASEVLPEKMRLSFFNSLDNISSPSKEDRIGERLAHEGLPDSGEFYIDVDLWHPNSQDRVRELLDTTRQLCTTLNGRLEERVVTKSLLLLKIRSNKELTESLLEMDFVAKVDLPPLLAEGYESILYEHPPPQPMPIPTPDHPSVCIVDSGVLSGHPFLQNWVIDEEDFGTNEDTVSDLNGHGTSVAGIVVYGDIAQCIENEMWEPKVKIYSAKILQNNDWNNEPIFPVNHRIEDLTERAIRHFAGQGCRIFNLSLGNSQHVYRGQRQFPWAEKIDELARELNIVIVISAGNRADPPIPDGDHTRAEFRKSLHKQLSSEEQRICSPATASLALTVGAIARNDLVRNLPDSLPAVLRNMPPPFTRTGPGYKIDQSKSEIKPDFVHFGGNIALRTVAGGNPVWTDQNIDLGEPTTILSQNGRFIGSRVGTSFACPHVAHAAALASVSLQNTLGQPPTANLIRALVGSSAQMPLCEEREWLEDPEERLNVIGYGIPAADDLSWSKSNRVCLVSSSDIREDKLHIYRVPIPPIFTSGKGKRGISVALAYDPPVRSTRKEYIARTMWFEAVQGLTNQQVQDYRAQYRGDGETPKLPGPNKLKLDPSQTKTQWSTLQVRSKTWKKAPSLKIPA